MKFWDFLRKRGRRPVDEADKKQAEKQRKKAETKTAATVTKPDRGEKEEKEPLLVKGQYILSKEVIIEPIITEKSRLLLQSNQYVFRVNPKANRREVKVAVERLFKVNVEAVNIVKLKKRVRGRLRIPSVRPLTKKAIVTVKKGQEIPVFE